MSGPAGVRAGVIGVGSMGRNHARVYSELPGVDLVGVADADPERAAEVADSFDVGAFDRADLLDRVDVVSVAVPTQYHYEIAVECIEAGVDALVEKPLVESLDEGRELAAMADERDVVVQVGHVERFNPAVTALLDIVSDIDPIAVEAHRLGPPLDRGIDDSVVLDLMIHDIDVLLAIAGGEVESVRALGTSDRQYATAQVQFDDGLIADLTASRRTQKKVRTIEVTAEDCLVEVDYLDQSIQIHRHSRPAYTNEGSGESDVRFRDERVIEQPLVNSGEPLKFELSSFVEAATDGRTPDVTVDEALRAIDVATEITDQIEAPAAEVTRR